MSAPTPPPTSPTMSQHFVTFFTNAFGFVAALAWADALTTLFQSLSISKNHPLLGPFIYAGLITLLAYVVGRALGEYIQQPCTRLCPDAKPTMPPGKDGNS